MTTYANHEILQDFVSALLTGDRKECSRYVKKQLESDPSIISLYENTLKESLYEIGKLWEYNKISVATEHMSTAIIEAILNEIYEKAAPVKKTGKKIITACVGNELHQVGIKMVADIFDMNGWDTFFLGANVPVHELITFAESIKPDIIALSLSIYFNLPDLENMINEIRLSFPEIKIIIGGQAFLRGGDYIFRKFTNILYLPDLKSIELFINQESKSGGVNG